MIALTGPEEQELREFLDHLDIKPPLVELLRQAVREFLVKKSKEPYNKFSGVKKEWAEKYRQKRPPLVIVP